MADTFINPNYRSNKKRIEQEEKELEELMNPKEPEVQEEAQEESEAQEETQEEPINAEEKTFKKRYGDLRRHLSQKEKEWEERFQKLEGQSKGISPPKSDEDIEAWVNKYPDVAGIVETIAQKKAKELFDKTEQRFEELDKLKYETQRKSAEQQIKEKHPDFDALKNSDEFHDWARDQSKLIQDALYENEDDARSVISAINLYKMENGTLKQGQAKEAAKVVKTKNTTKVDPDESSKNIKESDVARMSNKQYEEMEDKIMEAMKNGSFIYDISGGAR